MTIRDVMRKCLDTSQRSRQFARQCGGSWPNSPTLRVQHLDIIEEDDHWLITSYVQTITGCRN